jgi:hypothetical protein
MTLNMTMDVSECIRSKIALGLLPIPTVPPDEMWVGKGSGRSCNVCDQPITEAEIEHETDLPSGRTLRVHQHCLREWHEERRRRAAGCPWCSGS